MADEEQQDDVESNPVLAIGLAIVALLGVAASLLHLGQSS